MASEAALNLSVLELLQALNEKLSLECAGVRGRCFPPILGPIASVEAEVSRPDRSTSTNIAAGPNGYSESLRSKVSKAKHATF